MADKNMSKRLGFLAAALGDKSAPVGGTPEQRRQYRAGQRLKLERDFRERYNGAREEGLGVEAAIQYAANALDISIDDARKLWRGESL